jgi:hypothetical protein
MGEMYGYAKAMRFDPSRLKGETGLSELTGPYGFAAPFGVAPGGPKFMEMAGEGIGKLAAQNLSYPKFMGGAGDTVHFSPSVTINGGADDSVVNRLEIKLRDISRNFVKQFKQAQHDERRLSYEAGG